MRSRLSRRAFLHSAVVGAAAVIAGCRQAPAEGPTQVPVEATALPAAAATAAPAATGQPTAVPATVAAEARRGGILRFGEIAPGDSASLDPGNALNVVDWWVVMNLTHSTILDYDKDFNLLPEIAADMPTVSDDGLVYTIRLRKDVKFHNGRGMTAEDLKFTFDRSHWPETKNWCKSYSWNIVGYQDAVDGKTRDLAGVKVLDDYTLQITLQKPQATFMHLLTYPCWCVLPKQETADAGEDWGTKVVIGTGPFKVKSREPGQQIVLERFPDYFRPGLPYLDGVEIGLALQPPVAIMRFEQGELDCTQFDSAELERLLNDPKYEKMLIGPTKGLNIVKLNIHMKAKPFDDIRVRQAIAHAIDKQALIRQYAGRGWTYEGIYANGHLQFDPNFRSKYQYDPEKAKALLAEAGYPDGIKGVLMQGYPAPGISEMIQADLKAVGIETTIAQSSDATYENQLSGKVPLVIFGWGGSLADAYDFVSGWATCLSAKQENSFNTGQYCNQKIDDLVEAAEKLPTLDPQRIAMYREIEDIVVNQDVAMVGLYNESNFLLTQEYVHAAPYSAMYYHPYLEEAWLDK